MNLTNYVDNNNLHVLYYAANHKSARDFLAILCTTSQAYSERQNYHISRNITATDLMIHPDLHSIEVSLDLSLKYHYMPNFFAITVIHIFW